MYIFGNLNITNLMGFLNRYITANTKENARKQVLQRKLTFFNSSGSAMLRWILRKWPENPLMVLSPSLPNLYKKGGNSGQKASASASAQSAAELYITHFVFSLTGSLNFYLAAELNTRKNINSKVQQAVKNWIQVSSSNTQQSKTRKHVEHLK